MNFNSKKITIFLKNNDKVFLFLLISWIIILFSINTGFYSVKNLFFKSSELNNFFLINLINSLRWLLPFIVLPILLKLSYKKINYDLFSLNLIFISFFYFIHLFIFKKNIGIGLTEGPQLDGVLQLLHGPQFMDTINLLNCYLVTVLILLYIHQNYKNKILIFNIIFFSFICLVSFFIFFQIIIDLIETENIFLYYSKAFKPDTKYFDQPAPRITGWSRLMLIIFMFYFFYNELKKFSKKKYLINIAILFLLSFLIIFSQSRGSLIGYIFLFLLYLAIPKINFFKKIIVAILFIIIPFGSLSLVDNFKIGKYRNDQNRLKTTLEAIFEFKNNKAQSIENKNLLINDKNNYKYSVSSGRIEIWIESVKYLIKEKKIFGYGPQGDRYLLSLLAKSHLESIWGNNSSNAIIYSSISGGLIGLISILIIYISLFILFLRCFKKIFIHKSQDLYLISSFSIYCYIIMRSFFENGFAVFGIDFCVLITSYYFINSRLSILNKVQ